MAKSEAALAAEVDPATPLRRARARSTTSPEPTASRQRRGAGDGAVSQSQAKREQRRQRRRTQTAWQSHDTHAARRCVERLAPGAAGRRRRAHGRAARGARRRPDRARRHAARRGAAAARGCGHPLARRRHPARRARGRELAVRSCAQLGLVTRDEHARSSSSASRSSSTGCGWSSARERSSVGRGRGKRHTFVALRSRKGSDPCHVPNGRAGAGFRCKSCNTERMAHACATRNLGRISEIAQVAVRHGFGYFFERHKLTDLLPWPRTSAALEAEASPHAARPAPARDARRARPDVRQVRPAALDAAGHRAAGHHRRAP